MTVRAFSYGGGVQSTAALVLAAEGRIDFRTFLFANVGDDSEHPDTIAYVRDIAAPYAELHGIDLHVLERKLKDGTTETIMGRLTKEGSRSLPIPVRMSNGAPGTRSCTQDFKIKVTGKWCKEHGATPTDPAVVGIGISTDEAHRMTNRRLEKHEVVVYPLIDLRMDRSACAETIRLAGLPVPRKSACFFCPFHTIGAWRELRRDEPDLFAKSVALETLLNDRRAALPCSGVGKPPAEFYRTVVECETHAPDTCEIGRITCVERETRVLWGKPLFPPLTWTCDSCDSIVLLDTEDRVAFHGKDPVYFNSRAVPLMEIPEAETPLFDGDGVETCDAFSCFT